MVQLYDSYKDSGFVWLGDIPSHWEVLPIKHALSWKSEKGHGDAQVLSLYRDFGVVPKDSRDDNHNVTSEKTDDYKFVNVGDFVVNKMKAWQGSMALSNYEGIVSPAYYVFSFINDKVYKPYFHFLLRNDSYLPEYRRLSSGLRVGQWDLGFEDFKEIPFLLPPFEEQKQISSFLERKCEEIDSLITLQEEMICELMSYKQTIITEAVTKGLDLNAKMKDSEVEWIGFIPENWQTPQLKFITSKIGSGSTPTGGSSVYVNQGIKFLRSQNIHNDRLVLDDVVYITPKIHEQMKGTQVRNGDILFNITGGSIGRCYIVDGSLGDANVNQHVSIVRPSKVYGKYLLYFLQSSAGQEQVNVLQTGGNREGLTASAFGEFFITLPNEEEQINIANFLDQKINQITSLITLKQNKIEELKEYKKSIIFEYVTGKKRV